MEEGPEFMDRMTEREQFRRWGCGSRDPARTTSRRSRTSRSWSRCIPRIEPASATWRYVYFHRLDFPKAMDIGRRAVELYPKNPRTRQNYALYAMYAGDLKTAEAETRTVLDQSKTQYKAYLPLAAVAFVASDFQRMREAYDGMAATGAAGASHAAHGLADLAMYHGPMGGGREAAHGRNRRGRRDEQPAGPRRQARGARRGSSRAESCIRTLCAPYRMRSR